MPIINQDKWYETYYEFHKKYSLLKHYWNLIHLKKMDFFSKVALDSLILDIGCGDGNLLKTLAAKGYNQLYGFDIKIPEIVDKKLSLKKGSMLDMPYPENFADTLICFNVMHHLLDIRDYDLFLNNCKRVLRDEGIFFLVEPERNLFRKFQDIIIKIPIVSNIGPIKAQKIAIKEEKKELEQFMSIDIFSLFQKHNFIIKQYKPFLKSFILYGTYT